MSDAVLHGIDTSKHQASKVDYAVAKKCGIDFVILRIGCNKTKDKCFEADYAAAIAAGLRVGVYFYTYSTTVTEALADATRVLGWLDDRHLDLPVVYDLEDKCQRGADRRNLNSNMYACFASKIKSYGKYDTMLYTGEYFFNNYFNGAVIKDKLWIAQYSRKPEVGRLVSIWQYSSDPIDTPYFKGKLDTNWMLIDNFKEPKTIEYETEITNPYPEPARLIKLTLPGISKMKGNDVKWIQWELYEKGYLKYSDIDGVYGNITNEAVKRYQMNHALLVDGKVGTATRYCMTHD